MACCGRLCSIEIDGSDAFEGYISEITAEGERIDVTKFGDDAYGSFLTDCKINGTIMIQSYEDPGVSIGDTNFIAANVCGNAYTANCACLTKTTHFEATGVPYWSLTWAVEEDITGY